MTVEDKIEPALQEMDMGLDDFIREEKSERVHLIKKSDGADADERQEKEARDAKMAVKKRMKKHMALN